MKTDKIIFEETSAYEYTFDYENDNLFIKYNTAKIQIKCYKWDFDIDELHAQVVQLFKILTMKQDIDELTALGISMDDVEVDIADNITDILKGGD